MESSSNKQNKPSTSSTNLQPHVTVSTQQNDAVTPNNYTPPNDDCCPICFGSFSVPCKTNCGHWYCVGTRVDLFLAPSLSAGSCILQYWNYSAAFKPCKCPMCSSSITKLNPEASLFEQNDEEVKKVLENVDKYNYLFVPDARGLVRKLLPLLMKRIIRQIMMDPEVAVRFINFMRLYVVTIRAFYLAIPPHYPPRGSQKFFSLFDHVALLCIVILRIVRIFRQRRLLQRVRNLAAAEPVGE